MCVVFNRPNGLVVVHRVLGLSVLPCDLLLVEELVAVQEFADVLVRQGVDGLQGLQGGPKSRHGLARGRMFWLGPKKMAKGNKVYSMNEVELDI